MSDLEPVTPTPESSPEPSAPQTPPPLPQPAAPAPVSAEPRRKSRAGAFFLGAFSGCLVVVGAFVFLIILIASLHDGDGEFSLGDKIAVVPVEGEILDAR